MHRTGARRTLCALHTPYIDSLHTQVRIMFRKLKEGFEQTNAELREELARMHLQCNNRVFFGVGHSVSRLATALRTRTVAASDQSTFKPVPKTEVGAFRPQAHARSVLTAVPSRPKSHPDINTAQTWDDEPEKYEENWVQVAVDWMPEVQLAGGTFEVSSDGALVVKKVITTRRRRVVPAWLVS